MLLKLLTAFYSGLLLTAQAETILGVTVFTRHGDRQSKHYSGYGLTALGTQQNFQVGGDYRSIYIASNSSKQILGVSENRVVNSQIFATAPDQSVLLNTATAFLQGLYPPLEGLDPEITSQTLNNGSSYGNPLNGYQYVVLHGKEEDAPDTIWLKGDEGCPVVTKSAKKFQESTEFQEKHKSTRAFYESFWEEIGSVYDYQPSNLTYANAYDIFDLLNVASIHNASSAGNVTEEELFQLRTLADSAEFGLNFNNTDPARSIGGQAFAGGILNQLNQTVSTKGKLKFSLMAGSYDTFLAFFGISNLTSTSPNFFGLPHYAATMSFELFTSENVTAFPSDNNDLRVRFLFRNGSDDGETLRAFPLFGGSEDSLPWTDFVSQMQNISITTSEQWCGICQSDMPFCEAYNSTGSSSPASSQGGSGGGMSNVVAGVIGAMVTLGVVAILVGLAFLFLRRRRTSHIAPATAQPINEKHSGRSDSDSA
ncbi:phosphoglycerate mutase-like protein [Melanomma pulvis-pyrius CBS 109.77]|uniref:Phosphoglycerate mutase-like protein n=1 Tax=Melanomma pulvis-pyrius CBS 109.77 TaxID=1314802 RepID=A0A6A6XFA1_9PLEO|nr:phosphoglycerate mutase-like protein [Melanomma pulvis-pyrius CBS 109.77]